MNVETLIVVLSTLLVISGAVERLLEIAKPLFLKIADANWQKSVKVLAAVIVGIGVSFLFGFDMLAQFGLSVAPVIGYVAAGLLASAGSSVIHPLLEWLKTLKK